MASTSQNLIDNVTVGLYAGAKTAARFQLKPQCQRTHR